MKIRNYLLIFLIIIIAFWQVFFLQNSLKWDFIDAFLPSRYFFTEAILNNQFPFWNPYILYGIPIYADLSSVFNPEFWIIGNLFGYNNITLQLIYLLYIFIAGLSFKYLLKLYNTNDKLALGLSIAYMLSGITIGNSQNLALVSGFAIMPFVLAFYIKFLNQINIKNLVSFSISLFFMIYGSYPALTIILSYLLLTIFIYNIIQKRNNKELLKTTVLYHLSLIIIVLLFSSVLFLSYVQISPFLSQFNGISLEIAQQHPFSIQSFISFLVPMSTGVKDTYYNTDVSMANGYFGIISFVLLLFSLTQKVKNKDAYIFLIFGFISLLASLGNQFFVRKILFDFVPLMDLFRYPAIFRAFSILGFLVFIGINIETEQIFRNKKRSIFIIIFALISILTGLILWANTQVNMFVYFNPNLSFVDAILSATRFDNIILQGCIQILILIALLLLIWKCKSLKKFLVILVLLFSIDGIISTQLSINYTVINDKDPIAFSNYLKNEPKGFPIPELNPIKENTDKNAGNKFVWMNNNIFPKRTTFDGLISFKLNGYTILTDSFPNLLEAIKKEPLIYLSDDIRINTNISDFSSKSIFLDNDDFEKNKTLKLESSPSDKIEIIDFASKMITIKTSTNNTQILNFQQNYYKGWQVFIDNNRQELINSNFAHMSVILPKGKHIVRFEYSNLSIKYTFLLSYSILFLLILISIYFLIKKNPKQKKQSIFIILIILFSFITGTIIHRIIYNKQLVEANKANKIYSTDYIYPQTFENNNKSKWYTPKDRIIFDSISKSNCFTYTENDEWGTSLEIPVNNDLLNTKTILISADVRINKTNIATPLVLSVDNTHENKQWSSKNINEDIDSTNTWVNIEYKFNISTKLKKDDKLKIYFWNKNRNNFQIDKLKIKIFYTK